MPAPIPCDAPVTTATFCSVPMVPSFQNSAPRAFRQKSSSLDLAAGRQRIVSRPLQDRVQPASPDADVASAKERERERILQQAPQRESMIVALDADDPHEI